MEQGNGISESSAFKLQIGFAIRVVGVVLFLTAGWFELERRITETQTDAATALAQAKADVLRELNDLRQELEIKRLPDDAARDYRIKAAEDHISEIFKREKETQSTIRELERLCVDAATN